MIHLASSPMAHIAKMHRVDRKARQSEEMRSTFAKIPVARSFVRSMLGGGASNSFPPILSHFSNIIARFFVHLVHCNRISLLCYCKIEFLLLEISLARRKLIDDFRKWIDSPRWWLHSSRQKVLFTHNAWKFCSGKWWNLKMLNHWNLNVTAGGNLAFLFRTWLSIFAH